MSRVKASMKSLVTGRGMRRAAVGVVVIAALIVAAQFAARKWAWFEPKVAGGPATVRLISSDQYINAVHDVFGQDIRLDVNFAPPQRKQGLLALGASAVAITPGSLDQFDAVARKVAGQVVDERHRGTLLPCAPRAAKEPDDECAGKFFTIVGRLLYRRPLTDAEHRMQVAAARAATLQSGDFYAGVGQSLAAMMISPKFLYFSEHSEPDPHSPGQHRLTAFSKATRLSLFLWNSFPDDALLAAAEAGELHEKAELERQASRLLAAPERVERGVRAFFSDLLLFDKFAVLSKDPVIYPAFTPTVTRAAQEQILRLITDHLLARRADYRDLFTTRHTFVDAALAPLHQMPVKGDGWVPVALDQSRSAGLLTAVGFLAVQSHPGRSSPTVRGKAIREALLCQRVPDPPPNVNFNNFESSMKTIKTARERLVAHSTDPVCAGCHKITDPMGLALENFDGAGQFRVQENDAPIDVSGTLDGAPFTDVASFGQAMRAHPSLGPCVATRLYSYGVGRETDNADRQWLTYIAKRFAADGYRFPDLLHRMAVSNAFYVVAPQGDRS